MRDHADVLIIGGGAAGLSAANALSAEGLEVMILEGRHRLGGRIETLHDPMWPLPIERGAEFIHGKPPETWSIAEAGGACLYDLTDAHWVFQKGRLRKRDDFFERVEKVLGVVDKVGADDLTFDQAVARFANGADKDARTFARMYVSGFDAADPAAVSARWLAAAQAASEKIEGDRLFRVNAGYDRILQFLRTGISDAGAHIELGTRVNRIQWGGDEVEVAATHDGPAGGMRLFRAPAVVVTVPLGVLQLTAQQEGHIAFDPALPAAKNEALEQLAMGAVVKVLLRFREPFWEEREPDLDFFHAPGAAFPTWWTTLPLRSAVLTGWAGGPAAEALSGRSEDEILTEATRTLSKVLSVTRGRIDRLLAGAHVADWRCEPLSRGAYSYARVGGAEGARKLAAPVGGQLFFAGEATDAGQAGTVAGALASGRRVAAEVLRRRRARGRQLPKT
jgi:monoamine oxidase